MCAQLRTVSGFQHKRGGFYPLVKIRVGVERSTAIDLLLSGQAQEIVNNAVLLEFFEHGWNAALDVGAHARRPEAIAHLHGANRDCMQRDVRRMIHINDALGAPGVRI